MLRSTLRWSASASLALALVLTAPAVAQAKPTPVEKNGNTTAVARTSDGRAITNEKIAGEVARFWTPERMASAVDLDIAKSPKATESTTRAPKPDGPAGSVAPVRPSVASGADVGIQLNESAVVGKVYFTTPNGGGASCSASAVASGKARLVMTAGHCVHQGAGGQWYSNWQFVPRYRDGARPFGTFVAYQLAARTAWINSSSYDEDMAIAIMHNGGNWGLKVVETVGGHGMRWNWGYNISLMTALGYPSNLGGGESQYYCQSGTWHAGSQQIRMWCNMTYGSSGGPWLQEYNDQNGLGFINSVVSHGDNPGNGQFDGPYFDDDIKSLYDFAEGLSPA
ncbi:trypsin-like serine peptidase [Micromonospora sp. DT178]|uniref:trypsin-like serine peptidase n=1 Tax=Micromonospora sp. DT178 TaxID=3393436 RepID=UPI003CF346D0